jgi:hypothetical protein
MDPSDFRDNVCGIAFASDAVHCVIFWLLTESVTVVIEAIEVINNRQL